MLIRYQISNNFITNTGNTQVYVSGATGPVVFSNITAPTESYKSFNIPINMEFYPIDYGEDVNDIVLEERKKAINPVFDGETIKYIYNNLTANNNSGLMIRFRFWNGATNSYGVSYQNAGSTPNQVGFTTSEINRNVNSFKKSFFRLYFYDSNSGDTSNLLFTEDITAYNSTMPQFSFNELYWLRNDVDFQKTNLNKTVYMDARFFNAKTGNIQKFANLPINLPTTPITIQSYNDPINRSWRTSAITITNPKLNNGGYNFNPLVPFGANTTSVITMSELIMQ
jgi:hypothetical protein